jgi:hypothetical protein
MTSLAVLSYQTIALKYLGASAVIFQFDVLRYLLLHTVQIYQKISV